MTNYEIILTVLTPLIFILFVFDIHRLRRIHNKEMEIMGDSYYKDLNRIRDEARTDMRAYNQEIKKEFEEYKFRNPEPEKPFEVGETVQLKGSKLPLVISGIKEEGLSVNWTSGDVVHYGYFHKSMVVRT